MNIRNLKYSDPSKNGLPEVISMIISGLELVEYKDEVEGDTKGKKKAKEYKTKLTGGLETIELLNPETKNEAPAADPESTGDAPS